jgi:hypothetical protein
MRASMSFLSPARGRFPVDVHPLGATEHLERYIFSLMPSSGAKDREVLEHALAPVAKSRRLDGGDLQAAAQLVDHERGERFALDILGDDQ